MSTRVSLLNNELIQPEVLGNGKFMIYTSPTQGNSNGDNSLKVIVEYLNNLPDSDEQPTNYSLVCIVEEDDTEGNWYPVHVQYRPFRRTNSGRSQILIMQPNIFNLDEGVPTDFSDGQDIISSESRKQATLGEDFRIRLMLIEGAHGTAGEFQSVNVNLSYEKYSV